MASAFVIMPFAHEFEAGFRDVIEPAVEQAGLGCVRADQDPQGHVHDQMLARIFDSPVVVADISGANPNVFYELGIAHRAGRKTVTVAREDFLDQVPFDIGPYRVLGYPRRPEPGEDDDPYRSRVAEAVAQLAAEVAGVVADGSPGIANPVQDFMASRSALASAGSLFLAGLDAGEEEAMLGQTRATLDCVSLTGSGFVPLLAGHVESGQRSTPLRVRLLLLDPDDRTGWEYVYRLREGRPVGDAEVEEFLDEDRAAQSVTERTIRTLAGYPGVEAECRYYSAVPLFWAYRIDGDRLIVGHLARRRTGSRHLPVSVLVGEGPTTEALHRYYSGVIDDLFA